MTKLLRESNDSVNDYFPAESSVMSKKRYLSLTSLPSRLGLNVKDTQKLALLEAKHLISVLNENSPAKSTHETHESVNSSQDMVKISDGVSTQLEIGTGMPNAEKTFESEI